MQQIRQLDALLNRKRHAFEDLGVVRTVSFWEKAAEGIPENLCLHLRFGFGPQLSPEEDLALRACSEAIRLGDRDRDLGPMPRVFVAERDKRISVLDSRRTAVVKIGCLARMILQSVIEGAALTSAQVHQDSGERSAAIGRKP